MVFVSGVVLKEPRCRKKRESALHMKSGRGMRWTLLGDVGVLSCWAGGEEEQVVVVVGGSWMEGGAVSGSPVVTGFGSVVVLVVVAAEARAAASLGCTGRFLSD